MVLAFELSVARGHCPAEDAARLRALLDAATLPVTMTRVGNGNFDADALVAAMGQDKKVKSGKMRFVLAEALGRSFLTDTVSRDDLRAFLIAQGALDKGALDKAGPRGKGPSMSQSEMGLWLTGGFIVILLILSAFLSGSETALTATSRARMLRMQQEGSRRAGWVAYLLDQHERLLGAILLGNNLVNILASVLATSVFLRLFGETGVVYATLMMTVLVVVFAEVLPKTYAIQTPDQTALRAAGLLRILVGVLAPFTKLLQLISRTILRAAGFTGASAGSLLPAHEELRGAIDLHHKEGGVRKRDRDMLGGILDLGDTHVDEVMVHRKSMLMIDADLTPPRLSNRRWTALYAHSAMVGRAGKHYWRVARQRFVARACRQQWRQRNAGYSPACHPPWFVPETTLLIEQLNAFRTRKAHFALVVDEYGALMGLVTMEDILEEIVGHIDDEHDEPDLPIRRLPDGSLEVTGTLSIRDLNREMGWTLPDTEATSIAGLIIHEARAIPEEGQTFVFHGLRFHILSRLRNQILQININQVADPTTPD